jgi:threonine dehydratase
MDSPTAEDLRAARKRLASVAHTTPVLTSRSLNELAGCYLYFKCENFQRGGAFKFRGAANAIFSLDDATAAKGVATHSSGNHAAAVALAAQFRGIPAYVVLPTNAPEAKRQAAIRYGAEVIPCAPTMQAREETIRTVLADTGAHFVHPYDDNRVIAGQSTATQELLEQQPDVTVVMAPVSGGGLLSGTALAANLVSPAIKVFGAEPANADDARWSFLSGRVELNSPDRTTIADGLRAQLSPRTLAILRGHLTAILTCTEEQIVEAMRLTYERLKIVVEPSAAVPLATILANPEPFRGQRVGLIVSGGNLDLNHFPWQ